MIYLDTQDYIRLFNDDLDSPNHAILDRLIGYRDSGQISIGFSFHIVAEFITKPNAENRLERVRRGELIKSICGLNAFPPMTELAKGKRFPTQSWITADDRRVVSAAKLKKIVRDTAEELIRKNPSLNRAQRRKLLRNGGVEEFLRQKGQSWGSKRSHFKDFLVSDEIIQSGIWRRFFEGQCSDAEFEKK